MTFYEKEKNLIEMLQDVPYYNTVLLPRGIKTKILYSKIHNKLKWKRHWIDSSAKDALPPDFYSDKYKLMIEVMRVDDHGFKKNGKYRNPSYERERELENRIRNMTEDEETFNSLEIFIVPKTGLPTYEDHNYKYYLENFRRTIEKHKNKIANYKENHPGYKIIFYVFDESSAYFVPEDEKIKLLKSGEKALGFVHQYYKDKAFLQAFLDSDIDYLIWHTPFKLVQTMGNVSINMPKICVYDCKKAVKKTIDYNPEAMVSVEE